MDLEQMAKKHEMKCQMRRMEMMLERTIEGSALFIFPMATKISEQLTPFGRKLVNAQAAQIAMYKCTRMLPGAIVPEHEQQFEVTRFIQDNEEEDVSSLVTTASLETDENIIPTELENSPVLRDALIANDHGISSHRDKHPWGHVASLTKCSCQYHQCWGLPCHHIIRVMMEFGDSSWKTVMV